MSKCVVTGAAGFIGSHLADRLLGEGDSVVGLDCFTDYYSREIKEENIREARKNKNFTFVEEDLLQANLKKFTAGADYVYHQAAEAGVRASWGETFVEHVKNNVQATQRLLEACRNTGVKKFVYASSSSVYGDANKLPTSEEHRLQPASPYGVAKLAAENLCHVYWKNFGVPTVSLRYFTVYGPRVRPDMAAFRFAKSMMDGSPVVVYGDGTQTRDFTYVDDVVEANVMASRSGVDAEGGAFNIGGSKSVSLMQFIGLLEKCIGKKAEIIHTKKQAGDVVGTLADISAARRMLGWTPKINLEEGLGRFVAWYKKTYPS